MPDEIVAEVPVEENTAPVAEQPQGETAPESVAGETVPNPEAPKPEPGYQKRIDKLTQRNSQLQARLERLEAEQQQRNKPADPAPVDDSPKEEDFGSAAEYVKAVAAHAVKTDREARQKEERERASAQAATELQKTVQQRLNEFRKAQPDFDDVMDDAAFNTSQLMAHELQESEVGPAILYHFAKNPEDANRIAEMTDPRKVATEIAKIEVRLSSAPAAPSQAPKPSSPEPIKPIATSRAAVATIGDESDDEYFARRRAERAKR